MARIRFQNRVAESVFTLPVCIVAAAGVWWLPECAFSLSRLLGLVLCLLTTCIILETNTRWHIIRIRTRLMSCVWLALATCLPFLHPLGSPIIAATLLSTSYLLLFRCYQQPHSQSVVFHVFLMLGMGGFCTPVMPLMAIPFVIYLFVFLRSMSWKAFWAGALGLATPYWCYAVWHFLTNEMQGIGTIPHPSPLIPHPSPFTLHPSPLIPQPSTLIPQPSTLNIGWSLIVLVSIVHLLRTKYDDNIRTRMILYIYMSQTLLLTAFLLLQPAHIPTTLALLAVSTSPIIAHYFALTNNLVSNLLFILTIMLAAATATLNLIP